MFVRNITVFLTTLWVNYVIGNLNNVQSLKDYFKQCLVTKPSNGLSYCLGVSAINKLQNLDSEPEFDLIDGISLPKDASQEYRDVYDYAVQDPSNFRSIVDTFGHVFAKRAMRWDMDFLYPGLVMQVSPSFSPGSLMEFVLDPTRQDFNVHQEPSTGRVLTRSFVLPFLLGTKINISTIIPILFGVLVLIAKKAVIISKVALVLSSAFGLASLLFSNNFGAGSNYQSFPSQNYYNPAVLQPTNFGGHYNKYKEEYPEILYRGVKETPDAFVEEDHQNYHLQQDAVKKSRNFAWTDDKTENKFTV